MVKVVLLVGGALWPFKSSLSSGVRSPMMSRTYKSNFEAFLPICVGSRGRDRTCDGIKYVVIQRLDGLSGLVSVCGLSLLRYGSSVWFPRLLNRREDSLQAWEAPTQLKLLTYYLSNVIRICFRSCHFDCDFSFRPPRTTHFADFDPAIFLQT